MVYSGLILLMWIGIDKALQKINGINCALKINTFASLKRGLE